MARKKKQNKETTIENYYDLKVDKVDELVSILNGEDVEYTDEVSDRIADYAETEEDKKKAANKRFDPYKLDKMSRVPSWIKAFLVKIWSNGVVCFLFVWGMQGFIADNLDLMVLTGLMLGIINDLFVNTAFMHFQSERREFDDYMMFPFPFKKFWTFFANIFYYIVVVFSVYFGIYFWINRLFEFGLEPITFGLFTMLIDMAFIGIKDLIVHSVRRSKQKRAQIADEYAEVEGANNAAKPAKTNSKNGKNLQTSEPVQPQSVVEDEEETDEVEKLKRLAEQKNAQEYGEGNSSKSKNKKK